MRNKKVKSKHINFYNSVGEVIGFQVKFFHKGHYINVKCKNGVIEGMGEMISCLANVLHNNAQAITSIPNNHTSKADLYQMQAERLLTAVKTFKTDGGGSLYTYLATCARSCLLNEIKRSKRFKRCSIDENGKPVRDSSYDAVMDERFISATPFKNNEDVDKDIKYFWDHIEDKEVVAILKELYENNGAETLTDALLNSELGISYVTLMRKMKKFHEMDGYATELKRFLLENMT